MLPATNKAIFTTFAIVIMCQMLLSKPLSRKISFTCFLVGSLFFITTLKAAPIDSIKAKTVGTNFYTRNYSVTSPSLKLIYTEKSTEGEAEYYVYNVYPDSGFVIISADDAAYPIIAYSSEGYYKLTNVPPNFTFWMQRYKTQISSIRLHHIKASAEIQNEWNAYENNLPLLRNKKMPSSVPPLLTTAWAQGPNYYNAYCPITVVDGIDSNDPTGCIATAMAQIMKYWAYPPHGIGSNSYTWNPYGTLSADFDTTHYNWAGMPFRISSPNIPIATLMYDCGISVNMEYSVDNSGAYLSTSDNPGSPISTENAFTQYFGYSGTSIKAAPESNYSYSNWEALLENELNNNRPIQYAGSGSYGGHSWVCDGYDASGAFHMNWGWAGYQNGYFNLNSLNPAGIPLNTGDEVLIGIEPAPAVADFNANYGIIRAGDTVTFTDNSIGYTPISSWQWSFNGGTNISSSAQNPMVIYNTTGTYSVSETVTTANGNNTLTRNGYITVLDNNTVNVYPTLVNDNVFTVQLHDPSLAGNNMEFSLYDMLGNKVYTTTLTQYITHLAVFVPHGMYFFRAFNQSGKPVETGKLVIK